MQEQDQSRLSQFRRWATDKVKGLTPRSRDQTTRRATSAPSSPTSNRVERLRSTSLDNASPGMTESGEEGVQVPPELHSMNQDTQVPRIVVNSEFDCSAPRTRAGTNYLSRVPLRVLQPGHDQHPKEPIPSSQGSESNSNDISGQGKENRLQQLERELSANSQQHNYVHPLNGNYPPVGTPQHQGSEMLNTNEPVHAETYGDGIRVTGHGDLISRPHRSTDGNQPSVASMNKTQELKFLSEQVKQLVKDINYMNDHMMDNTDWWKNYKEYMSPYEERMRELVLKLATVDVFGDLLKWTCKQDEALASLKSFYGTKAQEMVDKFACTSVLETPDVEVIETETVEPTQRSEEHPEAQRLGEDRGQEREIPFSIWQDDNLEQSLSKTRCITNMTSGVEDARSKANFAQESIKELIKRVEVLENQPHNCDPNIYRRLATLEAGTEIMKQTSAAKKDVIEIQKGLCEIKQNRPHTKESIKSTELRVNALQGKVDLVHNLVKNLCNSIGQDFNVLSSTSHPDPDWGSCFSSSRGGTPIPGPVQYPRAVSFPEISLVNIRGNQHKPSLQRQDLVQDSSKTPRLSAKGKLISEEAQMEHSSGSHPLRTMPNDSSVDLNRIQPVPSGWRNRRESPLYTEEQIETTQYSAIKILQSLRINTSERDSRSARRLIDHSNHMVTLMENNLIDSLDSTEKVKDVYTTTMNMMQTDIKELSQYQVAYETSTRLSTQDEELLNTIDDVKNTAKEWLRDLQVKYRELGCGLRPLSNRHLEDIPVFDGQADISVYEFLDRFKATFQGEGQNKDKANIMHRTYLATHIKQMTEDKKDDFDGLVAVLMERFGPPQIVVSNIIEAIQAERLPSYADNERAALAAHLRRLESAYAQIANLPKYGINEEKLVEYLTSHECLESIRKRIPLHMVAELNKEFRKQNLSRTLLSGQRHYEVLRSFIADMAADYDSFQEVKSKASQVRGAKAKDTAPKKRAATVNQVQGDEELDQEPMAKTIHLVESNSQSGPGGKRQNKLTRSDGNLKCPLDGNDHKMHGITECRKFWEMEAITKRSLLRERACYACFQPREGCMKGCVNSPPKEMLCKGCLDAKFRFVPAAVMCSLEEHRSRANGQEVLGAMQQFLTKFEGKWYKPERVLDQSNMSQ